MNKIYLLNINEIEIDEHLFKCCFPIRYEKSLKMDDVNRLRSFGAMKLLMDKLNIQEKDLLFNSFGKPYLKDCHFNISHSGDYVLLAISNNEVGVDIEKIKERKININHKVFTDKEIETIKDDEQFYTLWTVKESLSKMLGLGLKMNFKEVDVLKLINNKFKYEGIKMYSKTFIVNNHVISITLLDNEDVIIEEVSYAKNSVH